LFAVLLAWRFLTDRDRRPERDALFAFVALYLFLTLVFARSKSILGPLVALAAGECLIHARQLRRPAWRVALFAALAVAGAKTVYDGVAFAAPSPMHTRMDPLLKQSLRAINELTPPEAVFLCYWDEGFFIQSYCGRPTLTDGLLEDRENLQRIIDESRAYYSPNEDDLWRLARQHGATHVLVPTNKKFAYSVCAGVALDDYFPDGRPTEAGRRTTLYKALWAPAQLSRFTEMHRNERFILFAVR
jgi:hypothetical protein